MREKSYWDIFQAALNSQVDLYSLSEPETPVNPVQPTESDNLIILTVLYIKHHGEATGAEIDTYISQLAGDTAKLNIETRIFLARNDILVRNENYRWTLTEKGKALDLTP